MGGTEPGAELGKEDVGANSQQQSLLLNETIAASIKNTVKRGGNVPVCQVNENTVQGYVCMRVCVLLSLSETVFPFSTRE